MSVFVGRDETSYFSQILFTAMIAAAMAYTCACGISSSNSMPNSPPAPPQPNFPSIPPEPITWSPSADPTIPAPPAEDESTAPWKNGSNDFPLSVASPSDKANVTSPLSVVANATPKNPIFFMRVYVDNLAVYFTFTNSIDTQVFVAPGSHTITVMAEDKKGNTSSTLLHVTVSGQSKTTITAIQSMPGGQSCSATFPSGSGRDGQICAAGFGNATFGITQNVSSPAMDGNSAEFSIAPNPPGCTGYCNVLNFNPIAGGNNVSHFVYDLYFYIDNPNVAQALEFDLNQTFGGQRWVWGSECNFNASGKWDIWNDAPNTGWIPTSIPCTAFPAKTWIHLVWTVERVGNQVHYISLQVGDKTYNVDTYYPNEQNWTLEEIDTAFQMDLDEKGDPYNVWLDKVNLTAY